MGAVGVTGTAAQVTIQAWSAPLDCQALTNPNTIETFLGKSSPNAAHVSTYPVTQGTSGAVMCEVDYKGRHLVVRDQGSFAFEGWAICDMLTKLARQQS